MSAVSSKSTLVLVGLFLLAGCGESYTSPNVKLPTDAAEPKAEPDVAASVNLSILSYDGLQELIAAKRGKVVVLDPWSTSRPPCLKDFHHLVEIHKQYGPATVACISLSFDYEGFGKPEDVREKVLAFLRTQGATFDNVLSSEESDVLYRKLKLNSVPAVFVYDRSGQLRQRFDNEGAYEKVRAVVAELVKQASP